MGASINSINAKGATRIINGSEATYYSQFPYMVSLQKIIELQNDTRGHRCGGALVTLQHVLTAASCSFEPKNGGMVYINPHAYRVFAGGVNLADDTTSHNSRSISQIVRHPDYSTVAPFVDLAVFFLSSPFSSITNTPVRLPLVDTDIFLSVCYVSGWGAQNATSSASVQLMYLRKSIGEIRDCTRYYEYQLINTNSLVCAHGVNFAEFAGCTGDIGNPLVCENYLHGIQILNKNCTVSDAPEVYTRVFKHRSWINGLIGMDEPAPGTASTFQPGIAVLAVIVTIQIITANVIH